MTDPHSIFDFDNNVTYSDTTDTNLTSPAISISSMPDGRRTSASATGSGTVTGPGPVPGQGQGPRATNHPSTTASAIAYTTISERDAEPADAANPSPDTRPAFLPQDLEYPTVTVHHTDSQQLLAASSTDAAPAASYTLGAPSFGSQPWVAPSGPFLDFAPQPIYEPTGELLHEHIHIFEEFDVPSISRFTSDLPTPLNNPPSPTTNVAEVATAPNGSGSVTAFVQPSLPRSALKRKASSVATTPTDTSADKKIRALPGTGSGPGPDSVIASNRSVTFERMSGIGPTSPDEGSTSSDLLAGSRAIPNPGASAGNRRTRQSSGSTPRPSVNLPSGSSQGSSRPRGSRTASGHPPSILPPEKVFPIQIGSDLFRLSGASISSDGMVIFFLKSKGKSTRLTVV